MNEKNEAEFKLGDQVMLKSGGPLMTIKGIDTYQWKGYGALCTWFDGKKLQEEVFVPETIKHSHPHD